MDHSVNILMFDNSNHILTSLECKDHVKYLGVLLDSHLSWKYHIDNVALKISRIIGVIARLRHLVPFTTLLSIYRSLILPYLSYGLAAWGQAAKSHLQKILVLQKRVLRLMYFSEPRAHAVPLFTSSKILPLNMLYVDWYHCVYRPVLQFLTLFQTKRCVFLHPFSDLAFRQKICHHHLD